MTRRGIGILIYFNFSKALSKNQLRAHYSYTQDKVGQKMSKKRFSCDDHLLDHRLKMHLECRSNECAVEFTFLQHLTACLLRSLFVCLLFSFSL